MSMRGAGVKFTLLIRAATGARPEPGTPAFAAESAAYRDFTRQVVDAGVFVTGDRLEPAAAGVTVRVHDGHTHIDPPAAEPLAADVGGYYVLDCRDLDEAVRWAGRVPTATLGEVEVRPSRVLH